MRKSLIFEASPATNCTGFATNQQTVAIHSFLQPRRAHSFFSLFKLLKEKKKEGIEKRKHPASALPRIERVLPSSINAAYFLSHGFHAPKMLTNGNRLRNISLKISPLCNIRVPPTCPSVALRVALGSHNGGS